MKILVMLFTIAQFLSGCATPPSKIQTEPGKRYQTQENGVSLFSVVGIEGRSHLWRSDIEQRGRVEFIGGSPYQGVGYRTLIYLQDLLPVPNSIGIGEARKISLYELKTGDFQGSIENQMQTFYTGAHRDETGLSHVEGHVIELLGMTCTQFIEHQSYGPAASNHKWGRAHLSKIHGITRCPLVVNNAIWEFGVFYTISVSNQRFQEAYGVLAPTTQEFQKDIETRLKPVFDSLKFDVETSQVLPDGLEK